jgi:hypothetical protein
MRNGVFRPEADRALTVENGMREAMHVSIHERELIVTPGWMRRVVS